MSVERPHSGIAPLFDPKRIDRIRRSLDGADNSLLDEWLAGRIDRRAFLRHASKQHFAEFLLQVLQSFQFF